MNFAHPWVLLFLAIPLALLVLGWRQHGHPVVMPFDQAHSRPRRGPRFLLALAHSLPGVILAVVIVLLAGPQKFGEPQSKRLLTNIQFLVDVSGSMTSKYGDGNRYDAAMANIAQFVDYRKGDAFGLSVFGDDVLHWVPLTTDPSAVKYATPFLSPLQMPRWFSQGTSIAKGLEACRQVMLTREQGDRMIILLTDGYSFDLANGGDEAIGAKLKAANIVTYCIHIETQAPPLEVQTIASMTGGQVFPASDPETLKAVFKKIDEMQKAKIEKTSSEMMDNFRPVCLTGAALLALALLASFGLRYTPW